jgi:hypothetical protein
MGAAKNKVLNMYIGKDSDRRIMISPFEENRSWSWRKVGRRLKRGKHDPKAGQVRKAFRRDNIATAS